MTEYFAGTPRELKRFAGQMEELHDVFPEAVVVGDVAHAAMYADRAYDGADPLTLRRGLDERRRSDSQRRPVPVVMPYGKEYSEGALNPGWFNGFPVTTLPHKVWWRAPGGYGLVLGGRGWIRKLEPELVAPCTRAVRIGDRTIPIRTFTAGTQFYVDSLYEVPGGMFDRPGHEREQGIFHEFSRHMFRTRPAEFLPDSAYQPFRDVFRQIPASPWIDLETLGVNRSFPEAAAVQAAPQRETITVHDTRPVAAAAGNRALEAVLAGVAAGRVSIAESADSTAGALETFGEAADILAQAASGTDGLQDAAGSLAAAGEAASAALALLQSGQEKLQAYMQRLAGSNDAAGPAAH